MAILLLPATGFSIGVSRLFSALKAIKSPIVAGAEAQGPVVVLVMDRERVADFQRMAQELRQAGIKAEMYLGGAGMKGGQAIGATNEDGTEVVTDPYSSEDVMASVIKALGISLEKTFTSKNNRPMKIANSGKVIKELFS